VKSNNNITLKREAKFRGDMLLTANGEVERGKANHGVEAVKNREEREREVKKPATD